MCWLNIEGDSKFRESKVFTMHKRRSHGRNIWWKFIGSERNKDHQGVDQIIILKKTLVDMIIQQVMNKYLDHGYTVS